MPHAQRLAVAQLALSLCLSLTLSQYILYLQPLSLDQISMYTRTATTRSPHSGAYSLFRIRRFWLAVCVNGCALLSGRGWHVTLDESTLP